MVTTTGFNKIVIEEKRLAFFSLLRGPCCHNVHNKVRHDPRGCFNVKGITLFPVSTTASFCILTIKVPNLQIKLGEKSQKVG